MTPHLTAWAAPAATTTRRDLGGRRPSPALVALAAVAEGLSDGIAVADPAGHLLLENSALRRLLGEGPDGPALRPLLDAVVRALAAAAPRCSDTGWDGTSPLVAARERRTPGGAYRVRGAWLAGDGRFGAEAAVLLAVTREPTPRAGDDDLRLRFGLTPRQAEVALLLARGLTNAEVAAALGVRPHTAERHTASVLAKLAVGTRAAVGATLRGGR